MQANGLFAPCRVVGVYAADLISLVLIDSNGRRTRDDLMLQLKSVQAKTVMRPADPPLNALKLYCPNAEGGRTNLEEPGPDPRGRDFVQALVRKYKHSFVHIPISGTGWLASLSSGNRIPGSLYLYKGPVLQPTINECVSVASEVIRHQHGYARGNVA